MQQLLCLVCNYQLWTPRQGADTERKNDGAVACLLGGAVLQEERGA